MAITTFSSGWPIRLETIETTAPTITLATDADGDSLTYSLSGEDASLFSIDVNTGVVTFDNPADFENPTDTDANDGTNSQNLSRPKNPNLISLTRHSNRTAYQSLSARYKPQEKQMNSWLTAISGVTDSTLEIIPQTWQSSLNRRSLNWSICTQEAKIVHINLARALRQLPLPPLT